VSRILVVKYFLPKPQRRRFCIFSLVLTTILAPWLRLMGRTVKQYRCFFSSSQYLFTTYESLCGWTPPQGGWVVVKNGPCSTPHFLHVSDFICAERPNGVLHKSVPSVSMPTANEPPAPLVYRPALRRILRPRHCVYVPRRRDGQSAKAGGGHPGPCRQPGSPPLASLYRFFSFNFEPILTRPREVVSPHKFSSASAVFNLSPPSTVVTCPTLVNLSRENVQ